MNDQEVRSEKDPEVLEQEIDGTRSAITQKLEALEEKVRDTVQTARETVEETITNVKSSVEETVETVKQTFDLELQVRRHPWPMLAGSVFAGFALGSLLTGPSRRPRAYPARPLSSGDGVHRAGAPAPAHLGGDVSSRAAAPAAPGILDRFDDEIQQVKGMAIGYVMSGLRDLAEESFPQLKPQIHDLMNSVTTKLGGTPISEADMRAKPADWR
jgi:ElaB/YqjD/DUF883 family membrane-anchored ribosome-binding protein